MQAYRNNNKPSAKNFIDDEAKVSSQDIDQFDSDEYEYELSGPINDSFINDNSQPTPIHSKVTYNPRNKKYNLKSM